MITCSTLAIGSQGPIAPAISGADAPEHKPVRLQRTRKAHNFTPPGAIYVGRPTIFANPFERRSRIGHKRSVILYDAWLSGQLTSYILSRCGFSADEIVALRRWRNQLLRQLPRLRGHDLQCWCPASSAWCHAASLIDFANRSVM